MRKSKGLLFSIFLFFFYATSVWSQQFQLQNVPNKITGTYTLDAELVLTGTLTVRHRGAASDYFVTFSAGGSGTFDPRQVSSTGGSLLTYQIYDSAVSRNVLKDLSANPTPQEVLRGSFPFDARWNAQHLSFVVILPPGQFPPAGTYTDTITLTLYQGTLDSYTQKAQRSFQVQITMPSVMELSLVPPGAPFSTGSTASTLDFGILEEGKTRAVDVIVRSNQVYTLSMLSQYGNAMQIMDPTDTSTVPLRVTLNSTPILLTPAQSYPIATAAPPTVYAGVRYAFVFTVEPLDFPTAGNYSCIITFTLQAQ